MAENTLTLDCETLRDSFGQWQAEQEVLDAEWSESLAALVAYQSHLDAWQQELVQERDALQHDRKAWEHDQAAAEKNSDKSSSQTNAQLAEAREKITTLSQLLLTRTEELRATDQRRGELTTELELARAHAKELAAGVEEQKRLLERERATWTQQMQHMRELLELRAAAPAADEETAVSRPAPQSAATSNAGPRPVQASGGGGKPSQNNPVLGSIMEQFGKLRQQRATDRQAGKNVR
jgi:chromosome segregation ATPase